MNMTDHYDESDNQEITLDNVHPIMNSYAFDKVLADARHFQGKYKIDSLQGHIMNIGFTQGNEPDLYRGEIAEWKLYDETHKVYVVDKTTLFVKGLNVVLFIVQLQNEE